jgi:hypothetical protein
MGEKAIIGIEWLVLAGLIGKAYLEMHAGCSSAGILFGGEYMV